MSDGSKYFRVALGPSPAFHKPHVVFQRQYGDMPEMLPARDIFREDAEGKITIIRPAPKVMHTWDPYYAAI